MACCAARDMDPDGALGPVRPETAAIISTHGLSPAERLRVFLPLTPCTPVYGVYRTGAIHSVLQALEANARPGMGAILAGDIVFLSAFLREHHMVATPEPLLHFRRGGFSHDVSRFPNLAVFRAEYAAFARRLREETSRACVNAHDHRMLALHRWWLHARILSIAPVRGLIGELMARRWPRLRTITTGLSIRFHPQFRRLVLRLRSLPPGSRIALFGAGRHTQRHMARFHAACRRARTSLACIADDRAASVTADISVPIVHPDSLHDHNIAVLIVSSDTYEQAMYHRACEIAPAGCQTWCLYNRLLEARPALAMPAGAAVQFTATQRAIEAAA